jgi:hypothetical protein
LYRWIEKLSDFQEEENQIPSELGVYAKAKGIFYLKGEINQRKNLASG